MRFATRILVTLVMLVTLLPAPGEAQSHDERFYQVVFVYMKDPIKFQSYAEQLGPIVGRYGGRADRVIIPASIYASEVTQPDFINIVSYDSREAYERFEADPEFRAIVHLREDAIEMVGVNAVMTGLDFVGGNIDDRAYQLEIAFLAGDGSAYRDLEVAGPARALGRHTELALQPVSAFGGLELPDVVKLHFYEDAAAKDLATADPRYLKMAEKYREAIRELIWVDGLSMPSGS